jgi:hypothetical protein
MERCQGLFLYLFTTEITENTEEEEINRINRMR